MSLQTWIPQSGGLGGLGIPPAPCLDGQPLSVCSRCLGLSAVAIHGHSRVFMGNTVEIFFWECLGESVAWEV